LVAPTELSNFLNRKKKRTIQWWNSTKIGDDLRNNWKFKLKKLRQQFRGWNHNHKGSIKRKKKECLEALDELKLLHEIRELDDLELLKRTYYTVILD
jgi:hypothetical protein